MIDRHELLAAYETVRRELLAEREPAGHWVGRLCSSPLATATAASALAVVSRQVADDARRDGYAQLARRAAEWLTRVQNADGGWGDTDRSFSNLAATLLVCSALRLSGVAEACRPQMDRAAAYIAAQGGATGLRRRYGKDKTFAAPILTNCALAGLVRWRDVPALPFELACLPFRTLRFLRLPVVSYALPALVAIGQARFFHRRPWNPLVWVLRRLCVGASLRAVERMQPPSGGFLEAAPLTSFVVMGLASTGRVDHPVVRRGVDFLLSNVREDGSWPIDVSLASWNTSLAVAALAAAAGNLGELGCVGWLLRSQWAEVHPFTQAPPGGWGWNDAAGAVPDADDTAAALLALRAIVDSAAESQREPIEAAVGRGVAWLLDLQNEDGGWPTFCRGWGTMPFDRSGCDLTAHALRALHAWKTIAPGRADEAIGRGLAFLAGRQRPDGSWVPLWFGNQFFPDEENPVYGTARALLAYRDLGLMETPPARRGAEWLATHTDPGGGWGGGPGGQSSGGVPGGTSVEETSLAVEALLAAPNDPATGASLEEGLRWLVAAIAHGRQRESAPIGLYFAKLWYYEKLYPLVFSVSALGQAIRRFPPSP